MSQLETLRQAIAVSPDNVPLLVLFAEACMDAFQPVEACTAYERILGLDPTNRQARLGLARALNQTGKLSEAIVRMEAMGEDHPEDAEVHQLLSRLFLADGNRREALKHYKTSRKLGGGAPDPELDREFEAEADAGASRKTRIPVFGDEDETDPDLEAESLVEYEEPSVTFEDAGGMDAVKEELRMKVLYPIQRPELFKAYGKKIGGGVLLYGPPGCGKTLLSRATAGEMQSGFISVGIHQILNLYLGRSEQNLHGLFELARERKPSILFFDEVDALAGDRTHLRHSAGRSLVNQFLDEIDGTKNENEGVLVLAATNAPWHMDGAFLRPGRFDRVLFVPPPDEPARRSIIEILARDKPMDHLDAGALARKTKEFSGADLKNVFDLAVERALGVAMKSGEVVPLTTKDLLKAAREVKPTTRSWFETARSYALYSNRGGLYDDVLSYLGITK